jgi:hypothetical protein
VTISIAGGMSAFADDDGPDSVGRSFVSVHRQESRSLSMKLGFGFVGILGLVMVACGGEGSGGEWVRSDYPGLYAQSLRDDAGTVTELRSAADDKTVATMTVRGDTATWCDLAGTTHTIVVGTSRGTAGETTVAELPTDESTANELLYLLETAFEPDGPEAPSPQPPTFSPDPGGGSCWGACGDFICCVCCDNGICICGPKKNA